MSIRHTMADVELDEFTVHRPNPLRRAISIESQGRQLTHIKAPFPARGVLGEFRLGSHSYVVRRESIFEHTYVLERGNQTVASASRTRLLSIEAVISTTVGQFDLVPRRISSKSSLLQNGVLVGTVRPWSLLPDVDARLLRAIPTEEQIFIICLVNMELRSKG